MHLSSSFRAISHETTRSFGQGWTDAFAETDFVEDEENVVAKSSPQFERADELIGE